MDDEPWRRPRLFPFFDNEPWRRPRPLPFFDERPPQPPQEGEIDYPSALPDEILLSIIARVPLKQWLSLRAVSRHWFSLCALLPYNEFLSVRSDVAFDHLPSPEPFPQALLGLCQIDCSVSHGAQVDELLRRANDVCVQRLVLQSSYQSSYQCWIDTVELSLDLVLSIKSLTLLSIRGLHCRSQSIHSLSAIRCRHLWYLEVNCSFIDQHILDLILADCSALEYLILFNLKDPGRIERINIHSRKLKHLDINFSGTVAIAVDAPELEFLVLEVYKLVLLELRAPKTREASLTPYLLRNSQESIKGFLLTAQDLTSLRLSQPVFEVLSVQCKELEKLNLSFEKLNSLVVTLEVTRELHNLFLTKLLESCPSLSHLNVHLNVKLDKTRSEYNIAMFSNELKPIDKFSCRLEEVEISIFQSQMRQRQMLPHKLEFIMEFIRFFVVEFKSLKKITLIIRKTSIEQQSIRMFKMVEEGIIKYVFPLNKTLTLSKEVDKFGITIKITK